MTHKPLTAKQAARHMAKAHGWWEQSWLMAERVVRDRYPDDAALKSDLWQALDTMRRLRVRVEQDAEREVSE